MSFNPLPVYSSLMSPRSSCPGQELCGDVFPAPTAQLHVALFGRSVSHGSRPAPVGNHRNAAVKCYCLVVGGNWLPSIWHFPRNILGMSSSQLTHIFQRGGEKPPTRLGLPYRSRFLDCLGDGLGRSLADNSLNRKLGAGDKQTKKGAWYMFEAYLLSFQIGEL